MITIKLSFDLLTSSHTAKIFNDHPLVTPENAVVIRKHRSLPTLINQITAVVLQDEAYKNPTSLPSIKKAS